jgi:hypothetical protein
MSFIQGRYRGLTSGTRDYNGSGHSVKAVQPARTRRHVRHVVTASAWPRCTHGTPRLPVDKRAFRKTSPTGLQKIHDKTDRRDNRGQCDQRAQKGAPPRAAAPSLDLLVDFVIHPIPLLIPSFGRRMPSNSITEPQARQFAGNPETCQLNRFRVQGVS